MLQTMERRFRRAMKCCVPPLPSLHGRRRADALARCRAAKAIAEADEDLRVRRVVSHAEERRDVDESVAGRPAVEAWADSERAGRIAARAALRGSFPEHFRL